MAGNSNCRIFHLTPFFSPNTGGVETYLTDLTGALSDLGYANTVLTYVPLTSRFKAPLFENHPGLKIRRLPHIKGNIFYKLEKHPLLNYLYLTPYLGICSFLYFLLFGTKFNLIHAHGLNAAFIGLILKKLFRKPLIINLYSNYDNVPFNSLFFKLIKYTLNNADSVLTQSGLSVNQLASWGVDKSKVGIYRHWIKLSVFKPQKSKKTLRLQHALNPTLTTFLFVGRLIPQKGALLLAQAATRFPQYQFVFVGSGPQYEQLKKLASHHPHLRLFPDVSYHQLHRFYQLADFFVLPSQYSEGWGRVAMEAVACGLPVIGSNLGAISENLNPQVSHLFSPSLTSFISFFKDFSQNPKPYYNLKTACRKYAQTNFSVQNVASVTSVYQKFL